MSRITYIFLIFGIPACHLAGDRHPVGGYAYWSTANSDGSWTIAAEDAVRDTTLPNSRPADIEAYCPRYTDLGSEGKVKFWVGLLSAMAEFESNLDPHTRFTESLRDNQGQPIVSRGLLQISIESANQKRYACGIETEQDLHDPNTNIRCAAKILSYWVESDSVIAFSSESYRGGARYWSVLRSNRPTAAAISSMTSQLRFCAT